MRGLVFCLFLWGLSPAYAIEVPTSIEAVTVYGNGATVTRSGRVALQAGENTLVFPGLSTAIGKDQFQLEAAGAGVRLGQVQFDVVEAREAFDAEVRALQAKIDALQLDIAALDDSTQTAQLKLKFLDGIAQGYAKESWFEGARGNADVSSWRNALSVLDEGSTAARGTVRSNKQERREAEQTLSQLKREMQALRGKRRASLQVTATVSAERAQDATIKLHYLQRAASWSPQYTAYLDSDSKALRLAQKARVVQTTDEEWRDVELTLSTSQPSGELIAPDVNSQFLDLLDPATREEFDAIPKMRRATSDRVLEEVVVSAVRQAPQVANYAVTYDVPGRAAVSNDADEAQTFDLVELDFIAQLVTRVVPSASSEAFLVAKIVYEETLPLYASKMLVYVDQVYVGETYLETALPGDEITLPVGQDRRVAFTVRDQGGGKDESGFIGRRKTELTDTLFEIVSRRSGTTLVEVFDRYPTAVNDDIEVRIPRDATPPDATDFEDKPGVVVWRKSLPAGETWRIRHQYEVSYPADKEIVGR